MSAQVMLMMHSNSDDLLRSLAEAMFTGLTHAIRRHQPEANQETSHWPSCQTEANANYHPQYITPEINVQAASLLTHFCNSLVIQYPLLTHCFTEILFDNQNIAKISFLINNIYLYLYIPINLFLNVDFIMLLCFVLTYRCLFRNIIYIVIRLVVKLIWLLEQFLSGIA